MDYKKITETPSNHDNLELMDTTTILQKMNEEDKKIADAVEKTIPQVTKLVDALTERFNKGGRLFYIGAGTSG
ncbi:MAG: N-acetylmuramic acid 6-phosphate etherase, partial [Maribacter sp.]|nr:N-acetylmuramic acid 6-phosphate etherase [Maribacter sp.]